MERATMSSKAAQCRIVAWATALVLTSAATAGAQTFSWNWTGPYIGADAGYVSSRSVTSYLASLPQSSAYLNANQVLLFNQAAPDIVSARGVTGTLHAGWNWQLKPFALGIELDAARFAHAQPAIPVCCSRKDLWPRRSARDCRCSPSCTPRRARTGC